MNGNLALLTGMVAGALQSAAARSDEFRSGVFEVEFCRDAEGNYTNQLKVTRPSGVYSITVGMLEPNKEALE